MKPIFFLLFGLLFSTSITAQHTIYNYFNEFEHSGHIIDFNTPVDHSSEGPNMVWDFTDTNLLDFSYSSPLHPNEDAADNYPEANNVWKHTYIDSNNDTDYNYYLSASSHYTPQLVATTNSFITLHYNNPVTMMPNAFEYGDSHLEIGTGTYNFTYGGTSYSGNFEGTIETTVDAYGALSYRNYSHGSSEAGGVITNYTNATRLKTTQSYNIEYMGVQNAGTLTQTTYAYSNGFGSSDFMFIATHTQINIPSAGIDLLNIRNKSFGVEILNTTEHKKSLTLTLSPNPAQSDLKITTAPEIAIQSLEIYNIQGQMVWQGIAPIHNTIQLDSLEAGVYLAKIATNQGTITKRFLKN